MSVSSQWRGNNAEMVVFLEGKAAELERQIETIRNDTLEEAAGLCESRGLMFHDRYECADAIRKLKR